MMGPNFLNSLFGILVRFRLYSVALAAGIKGLFHQVRVPETRIHCAFPGNLTRIIQAALKFTK